MPPRSVSGNFILVRDRIVRARAENTITIALIDGLVPGNLNGLTGRVRVDYELNIGGKFGYKYDDYGHDVGGVINGIN